MTDINTKKALVKEHVSGWYLACYRRATGSELHPLRQGRRFGHEPTERVNVSAGAKKHGLKGSSNSLAVSTLGALAVCGACR